MDVLKVSANSEPKLVAGAIAGILRNGGKAEMLAIGASAINQAVKSIIVARIYVGVNGLDLMFTPSFVSLSVNGEERTGIKFEVVSNVGR